MATAILKFDPPVMFEIETRESLIEKHVPLVEQVATRINANLPPSIEVDDLIGAGFLGLIDAAERFDPARGNRFRTYAERRIRGAILDHLRSLDWAPRSLRRRAREIDTAITSLQREYGRAVDEIEVAEFLEMDLEALQGLVRQIDVARIASIDDDTEGRDCQAGSDDRTAAGPVADSNPYSICERRELRQRIADAIDALPEKERLVISLYYVDEFTMKEIGSIIGVNESRVSQIHSKAISHLRSSLARVVQ